MDKLISFFKFRIYPMHKVEKKKLSLYVLIDVLVLAASIYFNIFFITLISPIYFMIIMKNKTERHQR